MVARVTFLLALAFGQIAAVSDFEGLSPSQTPYDRADPTFRDFVGVNQTPDPNIGTQLGVGWVRGDVAWPNVEKQKGQWEWGREDRYISSLQAQGFQFLPTLDYTPLWAASVKGNNKSAPQNPQDWEDFVEQAVSRYSAPPYNLRYFQAWNEPTRKASFWTGTNEEFIDLIYLPAARIIRRHHCYVVFGGWPNSNSLDEFDQVLNYHDTWRWTDIVDIHYLDVSAWQRLYNEWIKTGKCRGIWESEIGFTTDLSYLSRAYLHDLSAVVRFGWTDPNQYRALWFAAFGNGPGADRYLSKPGPSGTVVLTENGIRLKTLSGLLGGGSLAPFTAFSTQPPLQPNIGSEAASCALGFRVGPSRIVIAFILVRDQNTHLISVQLPLPGEPRNVQFIGTRGDERSVKTSYQSGHLRAEIPRQALQQDGVCLIGYLQIDGL
jgi:hypothetical protein